MKRRDEDGALAEEIAALTGTGGEEAEGLVARVRDALDDDRDLRLSDQRRATLHTQARVILEQRAAARSASKKPHEEEKAMGTLSNGTGRRGGAPTNAPPREGRDPRPRWAFPVAGLAAAVAAFTLTRSFVLRQGGGSPVATTERGAGGLAGGGSAGKAAGEGAWESADKGKTAVSASRSDKKVTKAGKPKAIALAGTWETGGGPAGGMARASADWRAVESGKKDVTSGINLDKLGAGLGKISNVDGVGAIAMGLQSSSGGAGGGAGASPRESEPAQDREEGNVLTAGVFDDGRNPELFARYFASTPVAGARSLSVNEWRRLAKPFPARPAKKLQLAFLFDTTGSMSDELSFLQKEFRSIVAAIRKAHPGVAQEYALVLYRDEGDDYVTRGIKLTPDIDTFNSFLSAQEAAGGGDYPEAVDSALRDAHERVGWDKSADTARMLFWIGDAPPHAPYVEAALEQADSLAGKGVRVYPVAASGTDPSAEAVFRASAFVTGGQYVFLTDDSGVGDAHAKPKFPCYSVEKLKGLVIRSISDVVAGRRTMPRERDLVRNVGTPNQDGSCPNTRAFLKELEAPATQVSPAKPPGAFALCGLGGCGRTSTSLRRWAFSATAEDVHAGAGLTRDEVKSVLLANLAQPAACYDRLRVAGAPLAGRVTLRFAIGADGRVQSMWVASSELSSPKVESCMVGSARRWKYPPPRDGKVTEAGFTIHFRSK